MDVPEGLGLGGLGFWVQKKLKVLGFRGLQGLGLRLKGEGGFESLGMAGLRVK